MRWTQAEVLVTNDAGEYLFLGADTFDRFASGLLDSNSADYARLKSKHLLIDGDSDVPIDLLAAKYRTKKSFLEGFTALHLFVVTLRCDHTCGYCQVSRVTEDRSPYDMSRATADRAVALMFESPSPSLKVEFQGGEPLLNFELIRYIVELVEARNRIEHRTVEFVVATNLSPLAERMLPFLKEHSIRISTSLDGPAFIHDSNRPRRGGQSHATAIRNIAWVRDALGEDAVSALMTTTALSLEHPREIVDEYVRLGFKAIFLRWISPYGFAIRTGAAFGYAVDRFVDFYKAGLERIIELNRGGVELVEVYSQILLRGMLTPFSTRYVDLRSPAGAAIGAVAYNYDGDVYASDEARMLAEMRDQTFRLGNVHRDTYQDMFGGPVVRALVEASILETLPGCTDCAFAPYCGADPILNWATQGDPQGHRPSSAFCGRQMAIFRHLFDLLRSGDPFIEDLFASWATGAPMMLRPGRPS
jgi:His-Xaa-Ser system radical SAM maturase HxsB